MRQDVFRFQFNDFSETFGNIFYISGKDPEIFAAVHRFLRTAEEIFHNPCHPYTIGLMKSKPVVGKKVDALYNFPGSVPNPVNMPNYCYFRDRCEYCTEQCRGDYPPNIRISDTHVVSCYRFFEEGTVIGYPQQADLNAL